MAFWFLIGLILFIVTILAHQERVRPGCQQSLVIINVMYASILFAESMEFVEPADNLFYWLKIGLLIVGFSFLK